MLVALACAGPAFADDPTIAAVGDMGCAPTNPSYNAGAGTSQYCRQRYVSDLVVATPPTALLDLGDNQYVNGELANFQQVYQPTFGRANSIVYPSLGNAEYGTANAQGYVDYFSAAGVFARLPASAADPKRGWYSFDVGSWHVIALNSNCSQVGGCLAGSPQESWLKADLAANPNRCTLAYWHHPRWNGGALGNNSATRAFWTDLYNAGADVVLNGHGNHHYERFAPQDTSGVPDAAKGIREFIVSTGGENLGSASTTPLNVNTSQVANYKTFGLMRMTLRPGSYDWKFDPATPGTFTDSGTGSCHSTPAPAPTAPAAPSASASAGDRVVHLTWSAPSDGGAAITGYTVYRGGSTGGETPLQSVGTVTSFDDTSVTNGASYYYRVAAVNSVGEGPKSNEVSAVPADTFPATAVLDDFGRPAGPLGANWQSPAIVDPGTVTIQTPGVTATAAGPSSASWRASAFGADQEVYLAVPQLPAAGGFVQVAGRLSTLTRTSVSCYLLRVTPSTGAWELRKKLNGASSVLMTKFTAPFAAGDSLGLRMAGSAVTAYRKLGGGGSWSRVGSTANSEITAGGYLAYTLSDSTARGGAFGGGGLQ